MGAMPRPEVVSVGDAKYVFWNEFEDTIDTRGDFTSIFAGEVPAYIPATVIAAAADELVDDELDRITERFSADDVWNVDFMQIVLVQREKHILVENLSTGKSCQVVGSGEHPLPDGPYIISTQLGRIQAVARLVEDPLHAFIGGGVTYDASVKQYRSLHTTGYAIPSRLYYRYSSFSTPLRGFRFAVKDVIDVAGLKTSNGSRCWLDVYPAAEDSAPFIQQLTNAGAILVGKLNCTQFCDGQDPSERFEEVTPFNPRGDGYQNPSSSSSGSATAAAGYDWLDFTIGTDTGGSIRHPAGVNGVYGIRPTLHTIESRGMVASSFMDTIGVFARSAHMLEKVQSCMTIPSKLFDRPRTDVRYKLLYPVRSADADPSDNPRWFARPDKPTKHQKVDNIFESFVAKLEEHLNCKRQLFNMDELWSKTHPESMDANLSKATGTIYQKLVYSATANDVVKPFIAKYQAAHEGRTPYLEPIFKRRYEYGTSVTKAEVEKTVQQFETFRSWLLNVLFKSDPDEITILLFPQTWGIPSYRDEGKPPKKDIFWEAFSLYSISYVSGCPDITVPVGQVPYHSRITEHEEWLPVSLSFLSQPGNDRVLTSLLRQLEGTGVLSPIQTGTKTYAN